MHHASSCIIMHHASSCIIMHRHASWYIVMYHHVPPSSSSSSPPPYSSSHPASSASSPVETFMAQPPPRRGVQRIMCSNDKISERMPRWKKYSKYIFIYICTCTSKNWWHLLWMCTNIYIYVHIIHAYTAYIYVIYGHYIHYYTSYEKSKSSCGGSNRFRMHIDCCMLLRCKNHHLIFLAQEDNNNIFSSDIPQ